MKVYDTRSVRNIAFVSHQGSGKTSLAEAILFNKGVINRLGSVMQGTTVSDFDEDEIDRQMSLNTSVVPIEVNGLKLNILDTPGYTDFQGDVENALFVADLAVLLVDASAGVEVGTELYWSLADKYSLPRIIVINKMDRDNIQLDTVQAAMAESFDTNLVPLQLPMFEGGLFSGVIDLLTMKAYRGGGPEPIPAEMQEAVEAAKLELVEYAAEASDALMEKYFEAGELSSEEIIEGLKAGLASNSLVPVLYSAATANRGVNGLLDTLVMLAPDPTSHPAYQTETGEIGVKDGTLALYVFKSMVDPYVGRLTFFRVVSGTLKGDTRYFNANKGEEERFGSIYVMRGKEQIVVDTLNAGDIGAIAKLAFTSTGDTVTTKEKQVIITPPVFPLPVYGVAVTPATQADSAKMGPTLTRVTDEDPTLRWRNDSATREAVLEGMGSMHVDVAIKRIASLGVALETGIPKVPFRETISATGEARYRHKKQSGGAGQFGEVSLRVEKLPEDTGFEFANEVFGGAISSSFIPSIEKGIKSVLDQGVIAGYPVVDVKAVVIDGKEHPVDSKDIAFQIAGRESFKLAFLQAKPVILEPIMKIKITVPDTSMGDVIGDLSSRRGQVLGTENIASKAIITALVPLAEIQRYSNDLRSFTGGYGIYTLEPSHYQSVPSQIAEKIIAEGKKEEAE